MEKHCHMRVYHYAAYEDTALKKLAARHATREAFLDRLLREKRLVDLYRVTRESIRASTTSYSIKDIETFYRGKRSNEVQTAGASIVYYERYLETGDKDLLEKIERYNQDDVESTQQLHDWLWSMFPEDILRSGGTDDTTAAGSLPPFNPPSPKLQAYLDRVDAVRNALLARPSAASTLMADLLEFHRRSEKPQWWEKYARAEMAFDDLLESVDAIAGLVRVPGTVDEYEYPEQEIKFDAGKQAVWLEHPTGLKVTLLEIDEDRRRVRLSLARKHGPLPDHLSLGKAGPLEAEIIKQALLRVGQSVADGDHRYRAVEAYLEKQIPRLSGRAPGEPIVSDPSAPLMQTIDSVRRLDGSYLFIQGPPGAGKTYTGSHVIAALLQDGKRVAVSSNSHKAINNLLEAVEKVLTEKNMKSVQAGKKSTASDESTYLNGQLIADVDEAPAALHPDWQLMGGTAWLFSDPGADQQFDYLFVDEAGQVSVANLAAIGTCARNIVLLGDQMQLGQPIQGTHPGRSGESSLEYLLDGLATVPPDRGIFLPTTWRMCPDVCRFISDAVYDGRLEPEPKNANQTLVLGAKPHPALQPTGVVFWPMDHAGCAQKSTEEAQEIERIYQSLLKQASWIDREGVKRRIIPDDILVVAPYNMQVKLLQRTLPANARVGTVDKFQGQEAAVSIVSMTTSSEEDLPTHLEFLFSKNRLNVAISRARCLSIVVANPRLLDVRCKTPGEIALVNTIQGPPGAGKTYTGSHVIAALLADGKRVAVSSNSHKAINNLLEAVEKVLIEKNMKSVRAGKKSTASDESTYLNSQLIPDVDDTRGALHPDWQLMGGTAWLFSDPAPTSSSTTCSWTRPARCPWQTSPPSAPARRTSCCWATRCSWASRSRARTPGARASRRWSTCWTGSRPCRPTAASSCPPRGGCAPTCAGSSRRPCTTGAWSPSLRTRTRPWCWAPSRTLPCSPRAWCSGRWTMPAAHRSRRRKRRRSSGSTRACSSRPHGSIAKA